MSKNLKAFDYPTVDSNKTSKPPGTELNDNVNKSNSKNLALINLVEGKSDFNARNFNHYGGKINMLYNNIIMPKRNRKKQKNNQKGGGKKCYEYIINPNTNRKVSIYGSLGRKIIKNYQNSLFGGGKNFSSLANTAVDGVTSLANTAADGARRVGLWHRADPVSPESRLPLGRFEAHAHTPPPPVQSHGQPAGQPTTEAPIHTPAPPVPFQGQPAGQPTTEAPAQQRRPSDSATNLIPTRATAEAERQAHLDAIREIRKWEKKNRTNAELIAFIKDYVMGDWDLREMVEVILGNDPDYRLELRSYAELHRILINKYH